MNRIICMLVLLLIVSTAGCANNIKTSTSESDVNIANIPNLTTTTNTTTVGTITTTSESPSTDNTDMFTKIEEFLTENSYEYEKDQQLYQMVSAIDGYGYSIGDNAFELYKYEEGNQYLTDTMETGMFLDSPAYVNGNYILLVYDKGDANFNEDLINYFKSY